MTQPVRFDTKSDTGQFELELKNRFPLLSINEQDSSETLWAKLKATTLEAAKATLPAQNRLSEKPWISDETMQLIDEKRNTPRDDPRYKELTLTRAIKAAAVKMAAL